MFLNLLYISLGLVLLSLGSGYIIPRVNLDGLENGWVAATRKKAKQTVQTK